MVSGKDQREYSEDSRLKPTVAWLLYAGFLCVLFLADNQSGETSEGLDESLQAAKSQIEAGTYSSAITTLRTAMSQDPNRAEVHYWLGRVYYELHDYDSAIRHGKRSTQLNQRNSLYHQWLGRAYGGKAGRERNLFVALKVQKEFEEAVRLDPSNISARRDLQQFYMVAPWIIDGSERAREIVDAIAAIDAVDGHLARAEFYLKDLRPDLAENEYILVLDAKPGRLEPYFEIAAFYQDRKNGPAMESAMDYAEQVNPSDARISYYRGVAGIITGKDLEAAEKSLKSYLTGSPERSDWPSHAAASEWLGLLYEQEGKLMEAVEQYRATLQIDPGRKEARERLEKLEKLSQ